MKLTIKMVLDRFAECQLRWVGDSVRTEPEADCPLQFITGEQEQYRVKAWDLGLPWEDSAAIILFADERRWPIGFFGQNPMEEKEC